MEISPGYIYTEDKIMHTLLEIFQQGVKYSAQIASHQTYLRREEKFIDKKSLSIYALQLDYLNLDHSVRNNERAKFGQ